ncbi:MAG: DUF6531 domain-containing protein, partial [Lachnospiraceae bacterium]|nr:DUF6531 domain-containing protein [Lachnospiraceae bacterium]
MRKLWKRGVALLLAFAIWPYDCLDMGMSQTVYAAEEQAQKESLWEESTEETQQPEESDLPSKSEQDNSQEKGSTQTVLEEENLTAGVGDENSEPAEAEQGFTAKMQNNADVLLTWNEIEGGAAYSLYRDDILLYQTQIGEEKWFYYDIKTEAGETYHYTLVVEAENGEVIYTSEPIEALIPESLTIDEDFTLTEDMTVYSVTVTKGTVNLNGHTLKVCKDYSQSYGSLNFSEGLLYCYENFRLSGTTGVSMCNTNDYLYVGKSTFWNSKSDAKLTNGVIEAAGNFTVDHDASFQASGNHKVVFCGTEEQVVTLGANHSFHIVEITNRSEAGVRSAVGFQYHSIIRNGHDVFIGDGEPQYGFTLTEDTELYGDFYMAAETMDLNGYTLTVNGNLIQAGGCMRINGGRLIVNGDYRLETRTLERDGYSYGACQATLLMQNETDYVRVVGNLVDGSTVDHSKKFTNGILEVMGDVTVKGSKSYMPGANHTLILSGNGKQTVNFSQFSSRDRGAVSHLSNVEIYNESKDGVVFSGDPYVSGCMTDNYNVVNGYIKADSNTAFAEGYYGGSIKTVYGTEWGQDLTIGKNLTIYGSISIASYVKVMGEVTGAYEYYGNRINFQNGRMEVYGNMTLNSSDHTMYMWHADDELYVHGNLTYVPNKYSNTEFTDGIIRVEGNLNLGDRVRASGNHKVVLCGDDLQVLTISDNAYLAMVELQNYSEQGVFSQKVFQADRVKTNGCRITYGEGVPPEEEEEPEEPGEPEEEKDIILQEDTQWEGDYLLSGGNLDLNGYTLTIHGDLVQAAGLVDIHGGTLHVEGDYRIQSKQGENSYGESSGILKMTDEADYVQVKGSFFSDSNQSHDGFLTDGTMEIWGNVTVNDSDTRGNFCATDAHKLLLAGTEEQRVSMGDSYSYDSTCSQLCNVESVNESEAGVVFEGETYVSRCLDDNGNVMKGDIYIGPNTVFETGHFSGNVTILENAVLDQDLTIGGNLYCGSNLKIASNVVVKGDFEHDVDVYGMDGNFEMMHGRLEVFGDMTVGYNWYSNGFHMEHSDDEIYVHGNCLFNTADLLLSDGRMWIGGDWEVRYPFQAEGNHTFIFCGDKKQTIALCDETRLANVEVQNYSTDGIDITGSFVKKHLTRNNCRITYNGIEGEYGWTLEEDMVWEGDLILLDDTLDLNGHTLKVNGDLLQPGGTVFIHGGRLEIAGDYRIELVGMGYYEANFSSGSLVMTNDSDYVLVQGEFSMNSMASAEGKLTDGTLEVKGDFSATGESNYWSMESRGFYAIGKHRVLLSGNDKQCVDTNDSRRCQIAHIEITNESDAGVEFVNAPYVKNLVNDHGNHIKGDICIGEDTQFTDNHFGGGIIVQEGYTIEKELKIDGDVTLESTLQIDGTLRVAGDYHVSYDGKTAGTGTIVFCGTGLQQIDIDRDSGLPHVVLENYSEEGVHTDTIFQYLSLKRNGCRFSIGTDEPGYGMTLDSDYICETDMVLTEGTLDLNGHTLTVNGDFIQQGGDVVVHGGVLIINGDYRMQVRNQSGSSTSYSHSNGILIMDSESDMVRVSGDLVVDTIRDMKDTLITGTLSVSGDVLQNGDIALVTGAGLVLELCGEGQQTIRGNKGMTVGSLINNGQGGCKLSSDVFVLRDIEDNAENVSGEGRVCLTNSIQNEKIYWSGKLAVKEQMTLPADVCSDDTIYIEGELFCGEQKIETNQLVVTGTMHIQQAQVVCNSKLSVINSGIFIMQDEAGYVVVNGNMNITTNQSHAGLLTDGTLELRGNFYQQKYANFIASGHHTTILNGKKYATGKGYRQTISFAAGAGTTRFHRLIIRSKTEDCYFTPAVDRVADEVIYENTDTAAPMPVSYLKNVGVSAGTITLSYGGTWDEAGIGGYEIYRDGVRIAVTSQSTYTDMGLVPETEYSYQVYPYDRAGNMTQTSPVLKVTTLADMQAPEIPEGFVVASRSGTAITVSWHGATDNIGLEGYRIYRDGEMVAEVTEGTSYKDSGLEENADYIYQVSAYDAAGNESERSAQLSTATVMPKIISISPQDNYEILSNSVTIRVVYQNQNNCQGSKVKLEYHTEEGWQWLAPNLLQGRSSSADYIAQYTWNIAELERGRDYPIRVTLYDEDGNTDVQQINYRVVREEIQPPNYVSAKADAGTVRLTWESSSNVECSGYRIYRAVGNGSTYTLIREINDVEACEYVDTNVENQTTYRYQISGISLIQEESVRSDAVEVTANADTKAPVVKSLSPQSGRVHESVRLSAIATDNKAMAETEFQYHPTDDNTWITIEKVASESGWADCSWDTTGLSDGTYMVRAIAVDSSGNRSNGSVYCRYEVDNTGCSRVKLTDHEETATAVMLHWADITDSDFGYYQVEKLVNDEFVAVGRTSTELGYLVENCKPETECTFRVVAYDNLGNRGEASEELTVRTTSDGIAPTIRSVLPMASRYSSSLQLQMQAEDNHALDHGVFSYSLDGENYTLLAEVPGEQKSQFTYRYDMDISGFGEGTVFIKFEVYDASGNKNALLSDGTEVVVEYTIDHTAPKRPQNLASTDANGCVTLTWDQAEETDVSAYRIYRADYDSGIFELIQGNWQSVNYYDTSVEIGKSYLYKMAAVDLAGNVSSETEELAVTVLHDEERPQITGVTPARGSIIGANPVIKAWVIDNAGLGSITIEYARGDDTQWNTIYDEEATGRSVLAVTEWDTTGLPEGLYHVRVSATDYVGNVSEQYEAAYMLDLTPPERPTLSAKTGHFQVGLSITAADKNDVDHYILYRRQQGKTVYEKVAELTECEYTDTGITPNVKYEYKVEAYDENGNYSTSKTVSGYGDDIDVEAPTAIAPENIVGVVGKQIVLDGMASGDNVGISRFEWNMGNGVKLRGGRHFYTYQEEGVYQASLTVWDNAGNKSTTNIRITIYDMTGKGAATVTVRDMQGQPLPYAYVYLRTGEESSLSLQADGNGEIIIRQEVGLCEVAAYAPGYLPADMEITIDEFEEASYDLMLQEDELVVGDLSVRRMELQELVEAGVDLSDPDNYHTYAFAVTLQFAERPLPVTLEYCCSAMGPDNSKETKGTCQVSEHREVNYWAIAPQEIGKGGREETEPILVLQTVEAISWQKEMYKVDLNIVNAAESRYVIQNASATLNLPESGVSLAKTRSGQKLTQEMKDLYGGDQESISWVVKGDESGSYKLSADFNGSLMPFNIPVEAHFETENEFKVNTGKGIRITIMPERAAYLMETYYIQFQVENTSDQPLYNFSATFSEDKSPIGKTIVIDEETGEERVCGGGEIIHVRNAVTMKQQVILTNGQTLVFDVLKPGDSYYGTYSQIVGEGSTEGMYWELIGSMVNAVKGANLGVEVRVEPIADHGYTPVDLYMPLEDQSLVSDPVNVSSGAFVDEMEALSVSGVSELAMGLSYSSGNSEYEGQLGYGWQHDYEVRLTDQNGIITFYQSPGRGVRFLNQRAFEMKFYGTTEEGEIVLRDVEISLDGTYICPVNDMDGYILTRYEDGTYHMDMPNGGTYDFDADGILTRIVDNEGKIIDLSHEGNITTIQEQATGKSLHYETDEDGHMVRIYDDNGRQVFLQYTGGCLSSLTNPLGETRVYTYDENHRMVTETNAAGICYVVNSYDENGRVVSQADANGAVTIFAYQIGTGGLITTTVTDPEGNRHYYVSNEEGQLLKDYDENGAQNTYQYTEAGELAVQTDSYGHSLTRRYDGEGNLVRITDAAGKITNIQYDAEGNVIALSNPYGESARYTYDERHHMLSMTDSLGAKTTYTYDAKGQMSGMTTEAGTCYYSYTDGRMTSATDTNGNTTNYVYDAVGNQIQTRDALGNVTTMEYNSLRQLVKLTDAAGGVTTYRYDCMGNPVCVTDALGHSTQYTYDAAGNLIRTTYADGSYETCEYDGAGNVIRKTLNGESEVEYTYDKAGNLLLTTYPDGTSIKKEYDLLNQVVAETDSSGRTTRYEYYPNGNLYKTTFADDTWVMYTYDNSWRVIAETAQDGSSRTYKYDSMDHVLSSTDPLGNTVHYEYDKSGRLVKETDANGNSTTYGYDANGNCIEKVNALGVRCTMTYDSLNRMTAAAVHTSEGEYSVSYEYDSLGRVVSSTDEEGNTSHMEYDLLGNLLRVTDPKGNVTEMNSYDALNRVTHTEDALGHAVDYSYDGLGNLIAVVESLNEDAAEKTTTMPEAAVTSKTTSFTYDSVGRLLTVTDPEEGKTAQTYDGAGNVSSITDANGGTSRYTYDVMGRVLTATSAIGSKTSYTYNAEGLLQELRDANGESTSYTYDMAGRVTSMTDDLGTVSYTYDKNGNILTVTDEGGSLSYVYDALNRVTSYTDYNGRTVKYSYDELGNLVALTYPGGEIVRYTYYKNGYVHTVTDPEGQVTEYRYDACGRLTETVRPNGITEQCYYDAADRPVIRKEVRGSEVISSYSYTYDGWGNLIEKTSEDIEGASDGAGIDISSDAIMEYDADNRLISYNGQEVTYDAVGNMTYGPLDGKLQHLTYDCRNRLISAGGITYTYDPANNRIGMETESYREEYVVDSVSSSLSRVLVTYTYDKTNGNAEGIGETDSDSNETESGQ